MKRFLLALQFLTVLPVRIKSEIKAEDWGKTLYYFPMVGLLIGFLLAGIPLLLNSLPDLVKSALILITLIIFTGGIHLDGFADTCDGFYGSKSKEKILEIMRDSRIGVMGVLGIVSLLLLKFSLIVSIPQPNLWMPLIMMTTFARWSQVLACGTARYVREEGKAKYFIKYADKKAVFAGGFFTLGLFLLLMKWRGFILFSLSLLSVFLFSHYLKKKIGGMTGDTIGAVNEIGEVAILWWYLLYQTI